MKVLNVKHFWKESLFVASVAFCEGLQSMAYSMKRLRGCLKWMQYLFGVLDQFVGVVQASTTGSMLPGAEF